MRLYLDHYCESTKYNQLETIIPAQITSVFQYFSNKPAVQGLFFLLQFHSFLTLQLATLDVCSRLVCFFLAPESIHFVNKFKWAHFSKQASCQEKLAHFGLGPSSFGKDVANFSLLEISQHDQHQRFTFSQSQVQFVEFF